MNERTRAVSERFVASGFNRQARANMSQAAAYSATLHYLKAVAAVGAAEAKRSGVAAVARMKTVPVEDDAFGGATVREDGRVVSPTYLFEVKRPDESRGGWDYYKLLSKVAPEDAWRPLTRAAALWSAPVEIGRRAGSAPPARLDYMRQRQPLDEVQPCRSHEKAASAHAHAAQSALMFAARVT